MRHYLGTTAVICLLCATFWGVNAGPVSGDALQLEPAKAARILRQDTALRQMEKAARLQSRIDVQVKATWAWEDQAFVAHTPATTRYLQATGIPALKSQLRHWTRLHHAVQMYAQNPPHKAEWQCIGNKEENKNPSKGPTGTHSNTGNGYFDKLQMDIGFMRTYGWSLLYPDGGPPSAQHPHWRVVTGDHWTWYQQMWVAEDALKHDRGFYPWPLTAPGCVSSMWVSASSVPATPNFSSEV